jgi:hypothetical protein
MAIKKKTQNLATLARYFSTLKSGLSNPALFIAAGLAKLAILWMAHFARVPL